jgi:hypothetical protein
MKIMDTFSLRTGVVVRTGEIDTLVLFDDGLLQFVANKWIKLI